MLKISGTHAKDEYTAFHETINIPVSHRRHLTLKVATEHAFKLLIKVSI